ncbi:MAG: hypothetical protein ISP54_02970 [Flavobacteriales bacterium]|nr:hypothetical protein [Flavobacteriales bacterium]
MPRLTFFVGMMLILNIPQASSQVADYAGTGVDLCDCLPADSYLLLKKTVAVPGDPTLVQFMGSVEVLITFLGAYGHIGAHAMNLNWPYDLVVGSADLTNLLTGFNQYLDFEESLCSWEVVNVASHGWILQQIDTTVVSEAYVHESTYDEFLDDGATYGQCLLNSFDLEMVYLPDSVVRLTFVRKYLGNPNAD